MNDKDKDKVKGRIGLEIRKNKEIKPDLLGQETSL